MRAMLLAAGLGTRLGTLSDERPKPLLPVADVPILRYGLALLAGHGFREVCINLHHRGELIRDELARAPLPGGLEIVWSEEREILGTGGALKQMSAWLTDGGRQPFLVMNGKLILDVDLGVVTELHRASGALATMVVREVPDAERWGAVDLDEEGRVLRIIGEGRPGEIHRRTMFCGVHVIGPALVERLPAGVSDSVRQGYIPALREGANVQALLYDRYFAEHSTPERYLEGNFAVLRGEAELRHPPDALAGCHETARIGGGATLVAPFRVGAGAVIGEGAVVGPDAVIGAGAEVAPHAEVRRSVVWPGAVARGSLEYAIVTPRATHRVYEEETQ